MYEYIKYEHYNVLLKVYCSYVHICCKIYALILGAYSLESNPEKFEGFPSGQCKYRTVLTPPPIYLLPDDKMSAPAEYGVHGSGHRVLLPRPQLQGEASLRPSAST